MIDDPKVSSLVEEFSGVADQLWSACQDFDSSAGYLGNQLCRALDSIGANIAEGVGREYPGSVAQFYRYARGSCMESIYWLDRAIARKLLPINEGLVCRLTLQTNLLILTSLIDGLKKGKE